MTLSILAQIAQKRQEDVDHLKQIRSQHTFDLHTPVRDFVGALRTHRPAVIAEIKKASPSKGLIRAHVDVGEIAHTYETHGACCLSVLTEPHFFQGEAGSIAIAKAHSHLPVLRKDFIVDEYQIYESKHLGADCILLIVALLDDEQLQRFCHLAHTLGMAVLVESHTLEELQRALRLPTPLMGVNNRSLHTFKTDLSTSITLKAHLPDDKILITESGINHRADILTMQTHGIHAFLIGESLMREPHIGLKLNELLGC